MCCRRSRSAAICSTSWSCSDAIPGDRSCQAFRSPTGHTLGRVRFADYGSNGYVITRVAARRFLERTPNMVREIDQALSRFWDNGLNVLHVHPPVVSHDRTLESQIEETRHPNRAAHRPARRRPIVFARRLATAVSRDIRRRIIFRRLLRADRRKFGEPPPYRPTEEFPG